MKNMIALLIGMTLLTACGKQVGKDANNPLPPIGTPGDYIPANPPTEHLSTIILSNPYICHTINNGPNGSYYTCSLVALGTLDYTGGFEIRNIIDTDSSPVYVFKNNVLQCVLVYNATTNEYNQKVNNVWVNKNCSFNVSVGDKVSIDFPNLDSAALGGIALEITEYVE